MNFEFFQLRHIKSFVTLFALIIFSADIWALPSDASDRSLQRIVVLQSYHADFAWTDDIMKGIHKAFDNAGQKAEFYVEYMDTKRFPKQLEAEQLSSIQEQLTEKYRTIQPQVIIAVDDDALRFLLDRHETIFPQVPVVFCGVNNSVDEGKLAASKLFTGVMEVLDRKETIDAALALHPGTKKLAVITDTTTNGIGNRLILKELAKDYEGRIKFDFLDEDGTGITLDDLRSRVSKLNEDTIVYYGDFFRDKNGFLDQADIIPRLSKESRRPIYSPYSFVFGLGTVGGKLNSAIFQGENAAQMALKILKGASPSQIPVIKKSINPLMFDFRQMERWGIPEDRLPADSIVMYKRTSFFEEYRQIVIGTLIVFIILISVISALIVSIQRRKRADLLLQASELKYRTLIEQMPDMVWHKDINSMYLSCNSNYANVLGITAETIKGRMDEDLYKKELAAKYQADDKSVVMTGQPFEADELWEESGEIRWLHTSKVPLFDEGANIIGTIGIGRDITDRKRSEDALKENEERHRAILMTALDGFWLVDASTGNLIEVNDASASMLGYTSEELLLHGLKDIDVQWSPEEIEREMQKIKTTGKALFETRHRTRSGQSIDVEISVNYLPATDQFFSFIRNITERKQVESYREMGREVLQILNESGDLQENIDRVIITLKKGTEFDAVGIRLQDEDDFPYFLQKGFPKDFLLKENSLIERTEDGGVCRDKEGNVCLECTCGLVISGKSDPANPFFTAGGSFWTNDSFPLLEIPSEDDPRIHPRNECIHQGYASVALVPIRNKERIVGLIQFNDRRKGRFTLDSVALLEGIAAHIGEMLMRNRADEEKLALEHQFQQTQKLESLGVLAGGIAHDFNNILTIILGHCYIIDEDIDSELDQKTHVKQIERAANRAADLCRQMLNYAGKNTLVQSRVNLWLLVDENVKMLQSAIKKNVGIELDLKYSVPEITGDIAQIQQVVMNLIINAAEAIGDKNGTIKIGLKKTIVPADQAETDFFGTTTLPGDYACLTVSDSGCGMDAETQKRIFEPFFTTKFTGRGLGMSAVLGIIKSHEGSLQLSSTPGVGTTFTIYFPSSGKSEAVEATQTAGSVHSTKASGTVLIVDDEESLRIIGSALLKAMGFSVMTASNGREALEIYRERGSGIDLILMDLLMPEMGGIDAYLLLREISPAIPIVICSGYGIEGMSEEFDNDEYTAALQKPYKLDLLRNTLTKFIDKTE